MGLFGRTGPLAEEALPKAGGGLDDGARLDAEGHPGATDGFAGAADGSAGVACVGAVVALEGGGVLGRGLAGAGPESVAPR